MTETACIDDLRLEAERRLPRMIFDFVDGGSYGEVTCRANRRDLDAIALRQTILVDVSARHLATTILGQDLSMPLALAPTGLTGLVHAGGEIAAAQAAAEAGIPYVLSTMSVCSIEQLTAAATGPFWFQLYMMKDRGFVRSLVARAEAARCPVLMLTADVPVLGQRHRDVRNGLTVPMRLTVRSTLDIVSRPRWAWQALRAGRRTFGNLAGHVSGKDDAGSLSQWIKTQFDGSVRWADVEWLRSIWPGKLVVKGVLTADDARAAKRSGADAIVVSNHGGRQLDGAVSSIAALRSIVDDIGGEIDALVDSGIQSGQDVLRALAVGASGCMIGRGFLYGLAAGGRAGVALAIDIIRRELDATMALCGLRSIGEIDRRVLAAETSYGRVGQFA